MTSSKYLTTRQATELLGVHRVYLWSRIGKGLTAPIQPSPKKAFWIRAEVLKLKPSIEALKALIAA